MTKFMQAADLFESFKVVANVSTISIEYKEGETVDYDRAAKLIPETVKAIEMGGEIPVFVHLLSIENEDSILLNRSLKVPYYRNESIKVISSGANWLLLDEFIIAVTK